MQAVILAAGRARRLGPMARRLPKCLLKIDGRALVEYSLDNLVRGGVSGITLVTGHCSEAIQNVVGPRHLGVPVHYRFNPHYRETGSIVSLLLAAQEIIAPNLLVVESDILYHPQFIDAAMNSADDTIMVADASGSGDEVFVCCGKDKKLIFLGKNATPLLRERSIGEYAGIARLSAGLCQVYCSHAARLLASGQATGHYEDLIFDLVQLGRDVGVCHCPALPWGEVDTLEDLERAREKIYPELRRLWEAGAQTLKLGRPMDEPTRAD